MPTRKIRAHAGELALMGLVADIFEENLAEHGSLDPFWLVLSDEQMSKRWPFSLLNDEQMSNWLGVEHLPAFGQQSL